MFFLEFSGFKRIRCKMLSGSESFDSDEVNIYLQINAWYFQYLSTACKAFPSFDKMFRLG